MIPSWMRSSSEIPRSSSCSKKPVVCSSSRSASWRNSPTAERLRQPISSPCSSSVCRRSSIVILRLLPLSRVGVTRFCSPVAKTSPTRRSWPRTVELIPTRRNPMGRPSIRSLAGGAAGIAAGVIGGIGLSSISTASPSLPSPPRFVDAAHVPPVLTLPGEQIRLRFAVVCTPRDDGEPCRGSGDVYVRAGQTGPFRRLALRRSEDSKDGRYYSDLPGEIASSRDGFSYYAVVRDDATTATVTVPSGGAAAPQRSMLLGAPAPVTLGAHVFGHPRAADARVVDARWGSGPQEVGLAGSRERGFTGPSAFAVEADGSYDVLEPPNTLRSFRPDGSQKWSQTLSDRTWAKLAHGPTGPVVQQQPSEQWLPAAERGAPLTRSAQARGGRPGKPVGDGREVIVERVGEGELRVAEAAGNSPLRSWRITSATPLGEVQLAEAHANCIVLVTKTYTDERDEFLVLVLDSKGLAQEFSVAATAWAEAAPLARFRLSGSSLYRLGSTQSGAFVDRFDLEVPR